MRRKHETSQADLYGRILLVVGGIGVLASLICQSFVPIAVALISLFATLCFMNGLGTGDKKQHMRT